MVHTNQMQDLKRATERFLSHLLGSIYSIWYLSKSFYSFNSSFPKTLHHKT